MLICQKDKRQVRKQYREDASNLSTLSHPTLASLLLAREMTRRLLKRTYLTDAEGAEDDGEHSREEVRELHSVIVHEHSSYVEEQREYPEDDRLCVTEGGSSDEAPPTPSSKGNLGEYERLRPQWMREHRPRLSKVPVKAYAMLHPSTSRVTYCTWQELFTSFKGANTKNLFTF